MYNTNRYGKFQINTNQRSKQIKQEHQQENQQQKEKDVNKFDKKCQIHKQEDIKIVCLHIECQFESRLLCIKCMMGPHHEHYDVFTLIEEVLNYGSENPLVLDIAQFNQKIKEFLQNEKDDNSEEEVYKQFEKQLEILGQFPRVQSSDDPQVQDKMAQILILINSLYQQNLKFVNVIGLNSECVVVEKDDESETGAVILENQINFKGLKDQLTYVISQEFNAQQKISMKIKIKDNDNRKYIFMGSGNSFDIQSQIQNSKFESKSNGKWVGNQIDSIICIQIMIRDNLFMIYDINGQSVVENTKQLIDLENQEQENEQQWVLVMGTQYEHNFKVEILEFVVEEDEQESFQQITE
ncbi:hypothetical protein PPERSA_13008 [Pseudocohnilembus persalinus]|uniref:Uncharacterized protein n=1 Tax=Pseudocohnilembus persalinus TaxID=266149 RepID=A0A0V0R1Y8_PSEPJ|nr:hypothetical protein PPERSA_13008 [Pseudocohnilembus persalinus]|eukprot:KRX08527.1 hypothetical protein PPERSA_13008 [Pseudocohnilembus persalinus]